MITINRREAAAVYADTLREKTPYHIDNTPGALTILRDQGWLRIYLIDEMHIHCRMHGPPWPQSALEELCATWKHLPYSLLVTAAVLEKADWLEDNPGFRGVTVKGSDATHRYVSER